ncbi:alpha/beta hydrolase [Pseudofulvibacter geojedonensis]|uniref:Alpha/beta hydrolase n=1 Tax=Pseudofulvibacter geojedonensis TaxID=1123758 RepID=A0ABW3HYU9_9FLAO
MTTQNLSLYHLVRPANDTSKKAPLLLLLHGYGSNEEDLFSFASELPEDYFIVSARAPYDLQPYGHAWYAIHFTADNEKFSNDEEARVSRDTIATFIDELIDTYPIDANNVNLIGFSQGTILSYSVALSYPEKIKNVVALSGYLNESILTNDYTDKDHSHLDFYISHGSVDQVIPYTWANKAPAFLDKLNIKNSYREFPVGHGVAPQNFFEFKTWLESKL